MPGVARPFEPLYDLVGFGMWAYSRAAFRVRRLADPDWKLQRGELLVATHRAETDVPLICGQVFFAGGVYRQHHTRLHFAAREDMFDRGFFAGFPPDLGLRTRRLLYPLRAGVLLHRVRVNPIPYPGTDVLRVGRALESVPSESPLAEVLPSTVVAAFSERARALGLSEPQRAGDALKGYFADLLWRVEPREVLAAPALERAWRQRADRGTEEIRTIVEVIRAGEPILFFPEGRPSPDGAVGPLRPGLRLLIRRASPKAIRPVGLAYDPITQDRTLAYVAFCDPVAPPSEEVDERVLEALRRSLPLTCGQIVAANLLDAVDAGSERLEVTELDARFAEAVKAARAQGRPCDPRFAAASSRRARVADALRWVVARGLAVRVDQRALELRHEAILSEPVIAFAARELAGGRDVGS